MEEEAKRYKLTSWLPAIREAALPAIAFSLEDPTASRSRFGGDPLLPRGYSWPTYTPHVSPQQGGVLERMGLRQPKHAPEPRALDFILQLDLAELAAFPCAATLPASGLLTFFYDAEEQPWGYDPAKVDGFRIDVVRGDELISTPSPRGAPFEQRGLRFWEATSLPTFDSRAYEALERQGELPDEYFDFQTEVEHAGYPKDAGLHRLLGHSANVQGDMQLEAQLVSNGLYCGDSSGYEDARAAELEKGADDWLLLLQVDSDDKAPMMWGDAGMLYVWIRKQDLAERRFDRCWMTLQCG